LRNSSNLLRCLDCQSCQPESLSAFEIVSSQNIHRDEVVAEDLMGDTIAAVEDLMGDTIAAVPFAQAVSVTDAEPFAQAMLKFENDWWLEDPEDLEFCLP
jgi:L-alanine-DL-glutamate epimerase-like enolase superfamily enzyme